MRDWDEQTRQFEGIGGKLMLALKRADEAAIASRQGFGFVQTRDTQPTRRRLEVRTSQGLPMNQQITLLAEGVDTVRDLQRSRSPEAEDRLGWCHNGDLGAVGKRWYPALQREEEPQAA